VSLLLKVRPFDEVFSVVAVVALLLLLLLVEERPRFVATATAAVAGWLEDPASFVSEKNKTNVKIIPFLTRKYCAL
jgi:hypothetical protein